ncbi:MAG TPA: penicillin-binding protein 2 [Phenylobacterium sp.]|nr:penicillin-binding protein 2 [Phenylobacterium sp.]
MSLAHSGFQTPGWRWLKDRLWGLEHAFERAKAAGKAEDDTVIRIFFILALFGAGFLTLAAGAAKMAIFPDLGKVSYSGAAGAARADLVDRNGAMLAADLLHYGLYLDPREIWDTAETRTALLTALPDLAPARLDKALKASKRTFLVGALTPNVRARIHDLGLPGVTFEPEQKRIYPLGSTAAHLIGYSDTGGQGLAGAELGLNDVVRNGAVQHQAVPLSIDLRVQAALEDELGKAVTAFGAKGGVGLVTNVHTGEILGIASNPSFDPNLAGKVDPNALANRVAGRVYEMGSTFKTFTIAMALDSGKVSLNSTFDTSSSMAMGSRIIHDHDRVNYNMTVPEIYLKSSNIGASRIAFQAGGGTMTRYFEAFGLLKAAPVELPESAKPIVPHKWNDDTIASASFGHALAVSPLALAAGYGAIMNGGTYIPLTIRPVKAGERPEGRRVVSEQTSRAMLDLMRMNVLEGTGGKADAAGLRVGGKTGSAEKAMGGRYVRDKLVSSFAAVFPADGPLEADRYFVLIMLDEPNGTKETYGFRTGGWNATPTVGHVIDRIAPFLHVSRRMDTMVADKAAAAAKLAAVEER